MERVRHRCRGSMAQGPQRRRRSSTIRQRSAERLVEQYRSQVAETGTRLHELRETLHERFAIANRNYSQLREIIFWRHIAHRAQQARVDLALGKSSRQRIE